MPAEALYRLLLLWACLLLAGCQPAGVYQQEAFVFGTRVEVQIHGVPEDRARPAVAAVLREFDRLHRAYHAWQPSELTALNAAIARGEKNIAVGSELAALIANAKKIAADSDDLFNPALGRLIALWGFHADTHAPRLPPEDEIAAVLAAHPSMRDVESDGTRITARNRSVQFDFGGYAKGYALDRAAVILRERGIVDALINIGGNVMALGKKGAQPWRVGIADPRGTGALASLPLHDGEAIGTSGDYQRYFEIDGKRYCHILDPRTGRPGQAARAVTVLIAPGATAGTLSDATSKPLFLSDRQQWRQQARELGVAAVLRVDASGAIEVTRALHERLEIAPGVKLNVVD